MRLAVLADIHANFAALQTVTEHLEACAEIYAIAETLGGLSPLPEEKLGELLALRQKMLNTKAIDY